MIGVGPLTYVAGAAALAAAAYAGWLQFATIPGIESERDKAVADKASFESQHDKMVRDNAITVARITQEYRELEQQTAAAITNLLLKGKTDEADLAAANRRVADARRVRDDAQARYLAAIAASASADPAAACRRYEAASNLLGQLLGETDRVAEEAAGAADASAKQVIRLQTYITSACLARPKGATDEIRAEHLQGAEASVAEVE